MTYAYLKKKKIHCIIVSQQEAAGAVIHMILYSLERKKNKQLKS